MLQQINILPPIREDELFQEQTKVMRRPQVFSTPKHQHFHKPYCYLLNNSQLLFFFLRSTQGEKLF